MNKPKFRAWDKTKEEMIEVATVEFNRLSGEVSGVQHWIGHNTLERIHGKNFILMQYTGLKDKNGKQYCQEDLVRYEGKIYRLIKGTYAFELVGFYEASQDNPCDYFSEQAYYFGEIIGNIHANPELLNEVE